MSATRAEPDDLDAIADVVYLRALVRIARAGEQLAKAECRRVGDGLQRAVGEVRTLTAEIELLQTSLLVAGCGPGLTAPITPERPIS